MKLSSSTVTLLISLTSLIISSFVLSVHINELLKQNYKVKEKQPYNITMTNICRDGFEHVIVRYDNKIEGFKIESNKCSKDN